MGTFEFNTGNSAIDGKIEYTHTRTITGYTLETKVYMRRNNDWTGDQTRGYIKYWIYNNGTPTEPVSTHFTVKNGGDWCYLGEHTFTVSISSPLDSGSYQVGFKSVLNNSGGQPVAFNVSEQHMKTPVTVGAYAKKVKSPTISLQNNNDGTITINRTPSSTTEYKNYNNTKSTVTDCHCYYKLCTDLTGIGPTLSTSGSHGSFNNSRSEWRINIPQLAIDKNILPSSNGTYCLKVKGLNIGLVDGTSGTRADSTPVEDSIEVPVIDTPVWSSDGYLEIITKSGELPTSKATYLVRWGGTTTNVASIPVTGYYVQLTVGNTHVFSMRFRKNNDWEFFEQSDETWVLNINKAIAYYKYKEICKNDNIFVKVAPYVSLAESTQLVGEFKTDTVIVGSPARMSICTGESTFGTGIPWVYDGIKWVEAADLYVRTGDGWEQPSQYR